MVWFIEREVGTGYRRRRSWIARLVGHVVGFRPGEDLPIAVGLSLQVWWSRPSWVGSEERPCPCPCRGGPRVSQPLNRAYRAGLAPPPPRAGHWALDMNYGQGRRGDFFGKGQTNFVNLLRMYMCFIDDLYICPKEIRIGKL